MMFELISLVPGNDFKCIPPPFAQIFKSFSLIPFGTPPKTNTMSFLLRFILHFRVCVQQAEKV